MNNIHNIIINRASSIINTLIYYNIMSFGLTVQIFCNCSNSLVIPGNAGAPWSISTKIHPAALIQAHKTLFIKTASLIRKSTTLFIKTGPLSHTHTVTISIKTDPLIQTHTTLFIKTDLLIQIPALLLLLALTVLLLCELTEERWPPRADVLDSAVRHLSFRYIYDLHPQLYLWRQLPWFKSTNLY